MTDQDYISSTHRGHGHCIAKGPDKRSGELLGAHMVGPEVTEQIQGFGLVHAVFAHPTLSEAMHESFLDALDRALHQ